MGVQEENGSPGTQHPRWGNGSSDRLAAISVMQLMCSKVGICMPIHQTPASGRWPLCHVASWNNDPAHKSYKTLSPKSYWICKSVWYHSAEAHPFLTDEKNRLKEMEMNCQSQKAPEPPRSQISDSGVQAPGLGLPHSASRREAPFN